MMSIFSEGSFEATLIMGSFKTDSRVLVELRGAREVRASSASRRLEEMSNGCISVEAAELTARLSSVGLGLVMTLARLPGMIMIAVDT